MTAVEKLTGHRHKRDNVTKGRCTDLQDAGSIGVI